MSAGIVHVRRRQYDAHELRSVPGRVLMRWLERTDGVRRRHVGGRWGVVVLAMPRRHRLRRRGCQLHELRIRQSLQLKQRGTLLGVSCRLLHFGRHKHDTHELCSVPYGLGVQRHKHRRGVRGGHVFGAARRVELHGVRGRYDIERGRDAVRVLSRGYFPLNERRLRGMWLR